MNTKTKCACAALAMCVALGGAAGCSAKKDTTQPTVTTSQAQAEVDKYGNNNSGYCNLDDSTKTYSNGTVTLEVTGKKHVASLTDAKKIFSATLNGKQYNFPCEVKQLLSDGWELSSSNEWRIPKVTENRTFKKSYGENWIVFKKGSTDDYGTTSNEIQTHIANTTSDSAIKWDQCTLLGIAFDASAEDMKNNLANRSSFSSGIGINVGDSIDKVKELFGCWKYHDDSLDKESDLFGIYVNVNGEEKCIGYVSFYQTDGTITQVNIKVNVNYVDVLKS